jgi:RND superfamily putative drug exporter
VQALSRLATFPSSRRGKWIALVLWLLIFVLGGMAAGRLESVQQNNAESFLPAEAE